MVRGCLLARFRLTPVPAPSSFPRDLPSTNNGLVSLEKPFSSIQSTMPAIVFRWPSLPPCFAHADTHAIACRSRASIRSGNQTPRECWRCCSRSRQASARTIPPDLWTRRAASAETPSPLWTTEGTPLVTGRTSSRSPSSLLSHDGCGAMVFATSDAGVKAWALSLNGSMGACRRVLLHNLRNRVRVLLNHEV